MNKYRIRPMEEKDAQAMASIEKRIFSRPWTEENFRESFLLGDTIYFVAQEEETGELAGYCGCYQSFEEGNISNVAVSPDCRRHGIADALLTALIRQGKENGIETFSLEVRLSNAPAIALYRKHGFEMAGIRKGFYEAPREDAGIMLLRVVSNSHYPGE